MVISPEFRKNIENSWSPHNFFGCPCSGLPVIAHAAVCRVPVPRSAGCFHQNSIITYYLRPSILQTLVLIYEIVCLQYLTTTISYIRYLSSALRNETSLGSRVIRTIHSLKFSSRMYRFKFISVRRHLKISSPKLRHFKILPILCSEMLNLHGTDAQYGHKATFYK